MQRARGDLHLAFKHARATTVLHILRQSGCLKARLPHRVHPAWAEIVTLNNSGGVVGGDRLATRLDLAANTSATLTTASAERVYRCLGDSPPAHIRNRLDLAPNARAEWLPQETILFDGSALDRSLEVTMAASARLLGVEAIVFGRLAAGETLRRATLRDAIRIRRDNRLILHDALRPPPDLHHALQRAAIGGGARATATLFLIDPQAHAALDVARATLAPHHQVEAGASAWNGMLIARLLSPNALALRVALAALLHTLRGGRMLPRVWQC